MKENFYYIWIRYKSNGNDVFFLNTRLIGSTDPKWNPLTNDLKKAHPFSLEEAENICSRFEDHEMILIQDAHRVSCLHVSASRLKKEEIKDGDVCLLLSKRDQCGKNAAFWFFNGSGYGSDIRCSQLYKYKSGMERSNREFEYFVKFSKAMRLAESRVDIQDINCINERNSHHSIEYCMKLIKKQNEKHTKVEQ